MNAGGIRQAYREWGDGARPPVVLLHCLGADGEDWRGPLVAQLAGEHRVVAPDLRGHGGSDRPGGYQVARYREDLLTLLDALGIERTVLVGHSLGALVACAFAQDHRRRVDRLVLEEPAPMRPLDPPLPAPEPPVVPADHDWQAQVQFTEERNRPDPRWWDGLTGITAPTLLVTGGSSGGLPQREPADIAARIPDCRLVAIEGAGHRVHEERPREFSTAVLDFLAKTAA